MSGLSARFRSLGFTVNREESFLNGGVYAERNIMILLALAY